MLTFRKLSREEIAQVWSIDRTEVVDNVYCFEKGSLVLRSEHHDVCGWPPGAAEHKPRSCWNASIEAGGAMVNSTTRG